jgi:glucans biosynthesis protein
MPSSTRRRLLSAGACLPFLHLLARPALGQGGQAPLLGVPRRFDFDWLKGEAKRLAAAPHVDLAPRFADVLDTIDYDHYQRIRFRAERGLWAAGGGPFPVQLFHLGRFFKQPIRLHVVEGGEARELLYAPDYFDFTGRRWDRELPADLGFAGFRVMAHGGGPDWLAFLGAAYFRSSGELDQYGLSARAVAIDTAMPTPEEFPRFTQFWLAPVAGKADAIAIHALMDGPSLAGAVRIVATKDKSVGMEIDCAFYPRKDIARMGVAPLTSMFWYGSNSRHLARDWRPQIHDSEGLAIWAGSGERIWRPLNNPPTVRTSSFADRGPKGFGLLQRDRNFENYQDDGVFYDKRPSVWVEPLGDWGAGAVQLVEIPTDDEIHDNIVAYWVPATPVKAGSEWPFRYRLHWVAAEPFAPALGQVVATRIGAGGVPGQPRPKNKAKIVVDFEGGPIATLPEIARGEMKFVVEARRGAIDNVYSHRVRGTRRWRAVFDLAPADREPVELRGYLRLGERTLSETWLWQYAPPQG